jgi:hypothetical protein
LGSLRKPIFSLCLQNFLQKKGPCGIHAIALLETLVRRGYSIPLKEEKLKYRLMPCLQGCRTTKWCTISGIYVVYCYPVQNIQTTFRVQSPWHTIFGKNGDSWHFWNDKFITEDTQKTAPASADQSCLIFMTVIMKCNACHTVMMLNEIEITRGHKITEPDSLIN